MYSICKLKKWDIVGLLKVSDILYKCGKNMAAKYDLHHWDNSHFKNWIIILLCTLKNNIYIVYDEKEPVATFQVRRVNESLLFQKLATSPEYEGKGVGSFCLDAIEELGRNDGCERVVCEVFSESIHAKDFYEHRGYSVCGTAETLKYKEIKLEKEL